MKTVHVVSGIVTRGDEVLVLQRADYDNCWDFPGGKVEQDEHPVNAPKGERIPQPVFFAGENSDEDEWDLYATKLPTEIDGEEMIESRLREKREFAEKESAAYTFKMQRDATAEGKLF